MIVALAISYLKKKHKVNNPVISIISNLSKSIFAATSLRNLSFSASHILGATRLAWLLIVLSLGSFSSNANAIELVNDGVVSGSISVPGESDDFTFDASAGEVMHIRVVNTPSSNLSPKVWLYNPDGSLNQVRTGTTTVAFDCYAGSSSCELTQAGTYRLVVEDNSGIYTGNYEIQLVRVLASNENGALVNDSVVSGDITVGDIDTFVFDASAGEVIHIRVVNTPSSNLSPKVWLYNPDGSLNQVRTGTTTVAFDCYAGSSSCELTQAGTYRLVVEDNSGIYTGNYEIQLVRVLASNENGALVNDSVVSGDITVGDIDTFVFDASAGEVIHIRVVNTPSSNLSPKVWLYNPDGSLNQVRTGTTTVAFDCYAGSSSCELTQAGTYRLVVEDNSGIYTGNYEIQLVRVLASNENGALVNDSVVSGDITVGDIDTFVFDASAGEVIHIRVVNTPSSNLSPKVWLYNPDGSLNQVRTGTTTVAFDCYAGSSSCELTQAGTYRLVVEDNSGIYTGNYEIQLVRVLASNENGALVNDSVVSGDITVGDIDTFVFDASAGEVIHIRVVNTPSSNLSPKVWLYNPDGSLNQVRTGTTTVAFDCYAGSSSCELTQAGTYRLVVEDNSGIYTGNYEIQLVRVLASNENGALVNDSVVSGDITVGDIDTFVFDASAGEVIHIRVVNTPSSNLSPKVWLYNPDGSLNQVRTGTTTVAFDCYAGSSSCELTQAGTYRLVVEDNSGIYTGNYEIRLFNKFHFEFSIIPIVQVGIDVPVTIKAVDASGALATNYSECINLHSLYGFQSVKPPVVCLFDGSVTTPVKILGSGATGTIIRASSGGFTGDSNSFDTDDPLAVRASLFVYVHPEYLIGNTINPYTGPVYLEDSNGGITEISSTDSTVGNFSFYAFHDLLPGTYKLWAENSSLSPRKLISPRNNTIVISTARTTRVQTEDLAVQDAGYPPVLLVPGFAGSSSAGGGKYDDGTAPRMPKETRPLAKKLRIFDGLPWFGDAGFSVLDSELSSSYNVYTVPWDWRMSMDPDDKEDPWKVYLMPVINQARNPIKEPAGMPIIYEFDKVNIVAHSMGGLLVRSYIQSNDYRNDIGKFAMVGTPNEGAEKAYYMVEGGDPRTTDSIDGSCSLNTQLYNPKCFYSHTTLLLYETQNNRKSPFHGDYSRVISPSELATFYEENVRTGKQLLPTFPFLDTGGGNLLPISVKENSFLNDLNTNGPKFAANGTDIYARDCQDPAKVYSKAFISDNIATLTKININPFSGDGIYSDGVPRGESPPTDYGGDGTVSVKSAMFTSYNLPILRQLASRNEHYKLMATFKDEIKTFLDEVCP